MLAKHTKSLTLPQMNLDILQLISRRKTEPFLCKKQFPYYLNGTHNIRRNIPATTEIKRFKTQPIKIQTLLTHNLLDRPKTQMATIDQSKSKYFDRKRDTVYRNKLLYKTNILKINNLNPNIIKIDMDFEQKARFNLMFQSFFLKTQI